MPSQEERLFTLEQTVTALSRDIQEINHNETMLLGMAVRQEESLREVKVSLATLSDRVDIFERNVNGRFSTLEQNVNGRFESLERRFGTLEESVNSRFEEQGKKLDQVLLLLQTRPPRPEQEP